MPRIKVSKKSYALLRMANYPSLVDQIEALMKGGPELAEMRATVQAVRDKFPKPTTTTPTTPVTPTGGNT